MKLTIDRRKWGRGEMAAQTEKEKLVSESRLLIGEDSSRGVIEAVGKMCCLGFLGRKCGINQDALLDKCMPSNVEIEPTRNKTVWNSLIDNTHNTQVASDLAHINDSLNISEKMREFKIKRKMKKIGVEVIFTH